MTEIPYVPRSAEQQSDLVINRPDNWEYRLFASVILQGIRALEDKWRDHLLQHPTTSATRISGAEIFPFISQSMNDLSRLTHGLTSLASLEIQELAFGPPGVSGDADLIERYGQRLVGKYEDLMTWASVIRGTSAPQEMFGLLDALARFADQPIVEFRRFAEHLVTSLDGVPSALEEAGSVPVNVSVEITLDIDDAVMGEYEAELARVNKFLRDG